MNPPPLNVVFLKTPERGICGVCDGQYPFGTGPLGTHVTLVAVDKPTDIKVGECCLTELRRADDALNFHGRRAGIDHPTPPTQP